jgi:membrane dipeptidase
MLILDALNGSKLDAAFFDKYASLPDTYIVHATVNNLRLVVPDPDLDRALCDLALYRERLATFGPSCRLLASYADWRSLDDTQTTGLILGYQNSSFIGDKLELLELLHALGVRIMQITHNGRNQFGDGCAVDDDHGLTDLGRQFVARCNDLGLILDTSHTGDKTTVDVAAASKDPILVTHANARSVFNHARNKEDTTLRAVAERGGVVGICFLPRLLYPRTASSPTLEDLVRQVVHVHNIVGDEGIGFGSDFVVGQTAPERYDVLRQQGSMYEPFGLAYPLKDLDHMTVLADALQSAGMTSSAIEKFMGLNFARVLSERLKER